MHHWIELSWFHSLAGFRRRWGLLLAISGGLLVYLPIAMVRAADQDNDVAVTIAASSAADNDDRIKGPVARTDLYGDPLPAGATVRLGTVRYRAGLVAFAADDQTLIASGQGGELLLVDAATGKIVREYDTGVQSPQAGGVLTPDRQMLITIAHAEKLRKFVPIIQRYDLRTGHLLSELPAGEGLLTIAMIGRDGRIAITGRNDGMLTALDLFTGKELVSHKLDKGLVNAVAISPNGELVVAGTSDAALYYWERLAGKVPVKIDRGRRVQSLAFSRDGSLLAEGPAWGDQLIVRDVATREVLHRLSDPKADSMYVAAMAFTSDGKSLVAGNAAGHQGVDERVLEWDMATGKIRRQFVTRELLPSRLSLSSDDRWLAVAGSESLIKVWDFATGKLIGNERDGHEGGIVSIEFALGGRTAVTAGYDGTIRTWDVVTGKQKRLMRHGHWVWGGAALSPDGRLIASSSHDDTVRLWETATGKEIYRLSGHGSMGRRRPVAFTSDGKRFVTWGDDCFLRIWDAKTGKALSERRVQPAAIDVPALETASDQQFLTGWMRSTVGCAVISADARRLGLAYRKLITILDVESGERLAELASPVDGDSLSFVFSPDCTRIATSSFGETAGTLAGGGETKFPSKRLHVIRVREIASDRELFQVTFPDLIFEQPLAFSTDGKLLAVATRAPDSKVHVLNAETGELVELIEGVPGTPRSVGFSRDRKRLGCGFNDGTALVWDLKVSERAP